MHKGINTTADEGQTPIITHGGGFDGAMQQPFSIMPMNSGKDYKARETDVAQPIMAGGPVGGNQGGDLIAFTDKDHGGDGDGALILPVAPTLGAGGNRTGGARPPGTTVDNCDSLIPVAHALRGEGFDASEDGTGRGTPIVPVQHPTAIQERAVSDNLDAGPDGKGWRDDGAAYTLEARQVTQAVAFRTSPNCGAWETGERTDALTTSSDPTSHVLVSGDAQPFTIMERGRDGQSNLESRQDGTANAILTPNGGRGDLGVGAIAAAWGVRRLTPTECARLQGFPDDWARIPWRGKPAEECPDGPQYKAFGNSMAVNCMIFLGERIQAVMEATDAEGA